MLQIQFSPLVQSNCNVLFNTKIPILKIYWTFLVSQNIFPKNALVKKHYILDFDQGLPEGHLWAINQTVYFPSAEMKGYKHKLVPFWKTAWGKLLWCYESCWHNSEINAFFLIRWLCWAMIIANTNSTILCVYFSFIFLSTTQVLSTFHKIGSNLAVSSN